MDKKANENTKTKAELTKNGQTKPKAVKKTVKNSEGNMKGKAETTAGQTAVAQAAVKSKGAYATQKPKSLIIKLDELVPFDNHPYKVIDDDSMDELVESIREHGIMNPLIVRQIEGVENSYEIISGHRRFHAAQRLGLKKVPCTVYDVDRDTATVIMVDSNCQRTELLPSEKAWAYKMKMDALKRQGKRTDLTTDTTSSPVETKLRTSEIIAKEAGESRAQIDRYIRLTNLVPELLQFVDDGKIGMRPAVELSYLDEDTQRNIVDIIDEHNGEVFPSHAQARRIRDQFKNGEVTYEQIAAIMDEQKPNQVEKVKVPADELRTRIGKDMTDEEFIDYLYKAIEHYKDYLKQQCNKNREQGAR